jgi:3-dehydroquinate synthase II
VAVAPQIILESMRGPKIDQTNDLARLPQQRLVLTFSLLVLACSKGVDSFIFNPFTRAKPPSCTPLIERSTACKMLQVWCDCRTVSDKSHIPKFQEEQPDGILVLSKSPIRDHFPDEKQGIALFLQDDDKRLKNTENSAVVGVVVALSNDSVSDSNYSVNLSGQDKAMAALGSLEWVLVSSSTWQMIPAENLIAAAKGTGTKLAFCVYQASDVGGLARALELGVDGICVAADAQEELWTAAWEARKARSRSAVDEQAELRSAELSSPSIVTGRCWRRATKTTLVADRVCIDLIQSLSSTEGCFIGSSAKIMALILSESAASQFVPIRPFRINAGPVHSYILMGDTTTTKYLSELQPGDEVSVYNTAKGTSRPVAIGRLKQEVRPCVLVELESPVSLSNQKDGVEVSPRLAQIFLQQAETVRLAQEGTNFFRVTDLKALSDPLLPTAKGKVPVVLRVMSSGTHIGKVYDGKVVER